MVYDEITCGYGTNVKIEKSTLGPMHAWLFIRNSPDGAVKGALHINREQAKDILNALGEFLGDWE